MHSRCVAALSAAGLVILCLAGCGEKEKEKEKEQPPAPAPPAETRTAPVQPPEAPATAPSPKGTTAPALTLGEISSGEYLLARQHAVWANARRSLHSAKPNLNLLRSIDLYLGGRTAGRLAKERDRPNKDKLLAALEDLNKAYQAQVLTKLALHESQVKLKPGGTFADLRRAFDKIDADYKAFQAMTQPGRKTPPPGP